jgi:S-DNA-T family DNA segregation ATPase FtsK/SpoIIIE
MARARTPARARPLSSTRAAAQSGRRRRTLRPHWVDAYILQWRNLGLVALALFALLLPWRRIIGALGEFRDLTVQGLGYDVFLILIGIGLVGLLILLGRFAITPLSVRWAAAAACGALFICGLMSLIHPASLLAGISLYERGAGGELGRWLTASLPGVLAWISSLLVASFILWPRGTSNFLRAIPPAAVRIWRLNLHGRVGRFLTSHLGSEEYSLDPPVANGVETYPADTGQQEPAELEYQVSRATFAEVSQPLQESARATPYRSSPWQLPSLGLLASADPDQQAPDNGARARLIVETLASFGVDANVVQVNQGPTVTQFGIEPGWEVKTRTVPERDSRGKAVLDRDGNPRFRTEEVSRTRVRVNQITTLANDLALALAAPSIRIEAPVPGKPVVGVEVPNTSASIVTLRSVIETPVFQKLSSRSKLALALGEGVSGEPVAADLAKMPHLLIAGSTGAGKSVCINALIACVLTHATPDDVRFVIIDPKRVELSGFGSIPHLALSKVVVEVDEVVSTLAAIIREMESRYKRFEAFHVRNLEAYNRHPKVTARLPFWVVIIDELADLMMAAPYEVERQICRLAQLARATGIHLVVATQRPSVDVVTGLIKANFPTRIAFAVSSQVDSRTILDTVGAEKLLGRGDMLYLPTDAAKPRRIQGAFVSDQEIERLVNFWSSERWEAYRPPTYDHLVVEAREEQERDDETDDPLLSKAMELAQEHSRISASLLQRRLRIGYPRAARLMDELEEAGIVGAPEGGQSREVIGVDQGAI